MPNPFGDSGGRRRLCPPSGPSIVRYDTPTSQRLHRPGTSSRSVPMRRRRPIPLFGRHDPSASVVVPPACLDVPNRVGNQPLMVCASTDDAAKLDRRADVRSLHLGRTRDLGRTREGRRGHRQKIQKRSLLGTPRRRWLGREKPEARGGKPYTGPVRDRVGSVRRLCRCVSANETFRYRKQQYAASKASRHNSRRDHALVAKSIPSTSDARKLGRDRRGRLSSRFTVAVYRRGSRVKDAPQSPGKHN